MERPVGKIMKTAVVTSSRSEYGLLYGVMKGLKDNPRFELQVLVTGSHLSPEFGMTCSSVSEDGFTIDREIEILLSSDTSVGVSKSAGLAMISFSEAFADLKPDLVILLGDRTEILAVAAAATMAGIPIAHIHGGEITRGAYDDAIRHAITKMSHLHFAAAEEYRNRIIQMGEQPDTVFNVGGLGVDNIRRLKLRDRPALERDLKIKFLKHNLLVTYHPPTLSGNTGPEFKALLAALDELEDTLVLFTYPNADRQGRIIIDMINEYTTARKDSKSFMSLGQLNYLSLLNLSDAVVGNSSSGLLEAPSLKIPAVNIGDRQEGRIMADSVICCLPEHQKILKAIRTALSPPFRSRLDSVTNPYGEGYAAEKILGHLSRINLDSIHRKKFFDIDLSNVKH
jgi:GDP/UDP-N,N'-diacetylbacillosamine 2-epimerase (hydrolysing)